MNFRFFINFVSTRRIEVVEVGNQHHKQSPTEVAERVEGEISVYGSSGSFVYLAKQTVFGHIDEYSTFIAEPDKMSHTTTACKHIYYLNKYGIPSGLVGKTIYYGNNLQPL